MRIVVTGMEGQVARAMAERGDEHGHDIVRLGRPALDLTANSVAIDGPSYGSR